MKKLDKTPNRTSRTQRRPASREDLRAVLRELDANPPEEPEFNLVSRWAAKHVFRVDVGGKPWAFIRYLLGPASQYPDRWRHLRLGELLNEIRVGPRILGISEASEALGGRAAIVEAALEPIERDSLEERAGEAITLFTRLHSSGRLTAALAKDLTEGERERMEPFERFFSETRERWFDAVMGRWLEAGLTEISELGEIVSHLINEIEARDCCPPINAVVPAHSDPNEGNFMLNRKGALRMIDFEDLSLNHPVADLGVFLTWYVDADRHREILENYPLADPDAVLEWMRVWVPLRYLNIAAHWAARATRADEFEDWEFAVESVDEWLRGAAEILVGGEVPDQIDAQLAAITDALMDEWPLAAVDEE